MKEELETTKARSTGMPRTQAYGAALAAIQEGEVRADKDFDEAKMIAVVEKSR